MTPLSNGVRLRTCPANVPATSPPVKPVMLGNVVNHFVKVTSTIGSAAEGLTSVSFFGAVVSEHAVMPTAAMVAAIKTLRRIIGVPPELREEDAAEGYTSVSQRIPGIP